MPDGREGVHRKAEHAERDKKKNLGTEKRRHRRSGGEKGSTRPGGGHQPKFTPGKGGGDRPTRKCKRGKGGKKKKKEGHLKRDQGVFIGRRP